jgi:cell division protein FtsI/penicillin-binding protein 2
MNMHWEINKPDQVIATIAKILLFLVAVTACLIVICYDLKTDNRSLGHSYVPTISASISHLSPEFMNHTAVTLNKTIMNANAKSGLLAVMDVRDSKLLMFVSKRKCHTYRVCDSSDGSIIIKPWEPGSIMKPLTIAAALDTESISAGTTYYESGDITIGDRHFTNALPLSRQRISISDIIAQSLNTGAIFTLKEMGGGEINSKARSIFYEYLNQKYMFGKVKVGDLGATGLVAPAEGMPRQNERYASMSFGIGLTVTPAEIMAAYAALVNGGYYHVPTLKTTGCKTCHQKILKTTTSKSVQNILKKSLQANIKDAKIDGFVMGGKSGTAPVAQADGSYVVGKDSGTYIGYIGRAKPQYIVLVRIDEPETQVIASRIAAEMWIDIVKYFAKIDL